MSTLREERCYGLSCRTLNHGRNISVFHVKLTDSAARAFDGYQNSKVLYDLVAQQQHSQTVHTTSYMYYDC